MIIVVPFKGSKTPPMKFDEVKSVHSYVHLPAPFEMFSERLAEAGRKAWNALHSYQGDDPKTFFYSVFLPMVPSYGCSCRKDFDKILDNYPPDFSSPEAFFDWGVFVHNLVSEKLIAAGDTAKRKFTIEEARNQWRRE
jgi:hypothetical protein